MTNIINNSNSSNDSLVNSASAHETGIVLTKLSSDNELKLYFSIVREKAKSGEEFPFNFDEVWQLSYSAKNKAVISLKDNFIEGVDYQALDQTVECQNGVGCSKKKVYYLTTSCLEFFIARKDRRVFDIYRTIFHKAMDIVENQIKSEISKEEIELRNREVNMMEVQALERLRERTVVSEYKKVIDSYISEKIVGKKIIPLPEVNEKTYSATEIGKILGVSANKIGKLANLHGLKTSEFGKLFYDKSRYSNKEVETFRYYNKAIDKFRELLK